MTAMLRTGMLSAVGALAALALLGWTYGPADQAALPAADECEATFEPDTVERGSEETVEVTFSESVGMVEEVEAEGDSGLHVEWVNDQDEEPTEGEVQVDATDAESGTWEVTFHGSTAECEGQLTVEYGI